MHEKILKILTVLYSEKVARKVMARVVAEYGFDFIPSGGVLEKWAEAAQKLAPVSQSAEDPGSNPGQ